MPGVSARGGALALVFQRTAPLLWSEEPAVRPAQEYPIMTEQPSDAPVPVRLHEVAQLLREAHHLGPEAQAALAELLDELSQNLGPAPLSDETRAHLEANTVHLIQALHSQEEGPLSAARKRLEEAAVRL